MYWLTAFMGILSIAAPFALGYSDNATAMWTSLAIGFTLTGASLFEWAADGEEYWEYWVLGIAGFAAVIAPFIIGLNFMAIPAWTMMLTGLIAMGVAGAKLYPGRAHY